jgi:hypothetical protein
MEIDLKWLLGILGLGLGYLFPKMMDRWFSKSDSNEQEMLKLTLAIQALQIEIRHLTEKLAPIPKMQSDLNELHGKVREIKARVQQ